MDESCFSYSAFVLIRSVFAFLALPMAVSAEADVRWFLRRGDEDQQVLGMCDFFQLYLHVMCEIGSPTPPFVKK